MVWATSLTRTACPEATLTAPCTSLSSNRTCAAATSATCKKSRNCSPLEHRCRTALEKRPNHGRHETLGMFVWSIQVERAAPGRRESLLPGQRLHGLPQTQFRLAIGRVGPKRSRGFAAGTFAGAILEARAGDHEPASAVSGKLPDQFQAGFRPTRVVRRSAVLSRAMSARPGAAGDSAESGRSDARWRLDRADRPGASRRIPRRRSSDEMSPHELRHRCGPTAAGNAGQ